MWVGSYCCNSPSNVIISPLKVNNDFVLPHMSCLKGIMNRSYRIRKLKASMVDSYESSSHFAQRIERAWLISQQPRPVACSSCNTNGHLECKWCNGTGFFIIGDNMLCEVPSKNTTCIICNGKGSMSCSDCKGTGYRAKWLGAPPIPKQLPGV